MVRTALGGAYSGVVVSQDATGLHMRLTGTSEVVRVLWRDVDATKPKAKSTHGRGAAKPAKTAQSGKRAASPSPKGKPARREAVTIRERELTDAQKHAGMPSIGLMTGSK
jgi:hypothetical protein